MRNLSIGVALEGDIYRAYASDGISGNNIAVAKARSRAVALVQLFDYLSEEFSASFYDDGRIEIPEENQCTKT